MKSKDLVDLGEANVVTNDGNVVGRIGAIHVAADSGEALFVQVLTSAMGEQPIIPVIDATVEKDALVLPYEQNVIEFGPRTPAHEPLSADDTTSVLEHYRVRFPRGLPPIVIIRPGAN
jgi:sporulation protein YlmC with PRC-barrel domain